MALPGPNELTSKENCALRPWSSCFLMAFSYLLL